MPKVIHRADAGRAGLVCGAKPIGKYPNSLDVNWAWKFEDVTCKKCIAKTVFERKARR